MSFKLNSRELEALHGLTDLQFRVYVAALRPRMDYRTGVAGQVTRLSYQALAEAVEEYQGTGRKARPKPSKDQMYRLLQALERKGLIELPGLNRELVVRFVLADRDEGADSFVQKKAATKPRQSRETNRDKATTGKGTENNDFVATEGKKPRKNKTEVVPKAATPPVSGNISTTTSPRTHARSKTRATIPTDWQPSDRCLSLIDQAGIPRPFAEHLVGEFVLYWEERGEKRPGWDATFLTHCKRQWERHARDKSPAPGPDHDTRTENRGGKHGRGNRKSHHAQLWQYLTQPDDTEPAETLGEGPFRPADGDIRSQVVELLPRRRCGGGSHE